VRSGPTITSVEQGRRKPPPGFGEHADALFNLPGVMTELAKKAQDDRTPFGDRIELEQRADSIYEYDLRVVPGLLQTEGYARAVNQTPGRYIASAEIDRLVEVRMQRQKIFEREQPPTLHAILDEAILCRRIGTSAIMRQQLTALTTPRHSVTVQVLPFSAGNHDSIVGPLTVMRMPGEPDIAYTDGWAQSQVIDTPAEVFRAHQAFQQLAALALPPDMSAEMIQAYAEEV
jgi:hypothetical protein